MKISDEILEQLEFLQRDTTVWVRGFPSNKNEACAVIRNELGLEGAQGVSRSATRYILPYIPDIGYHFVAVWNDLEPNITKEDIILVLKNAYHGALEEGT